MRLFLALAMWAMTAIAVADNNLHTEEVLYKADGQLLEGYLAYDDTIKGKRPGILIVHEWWGLNDYARKRARMLANLGYTALAVDMYGDGKQAQHPKEAGMFAGEIQKNFPIAKQRFMAALDFLRQQPSVDPQQIAAIGYCFGGGVVLEMARAGVPLNGVVSFHGALGASKPPEPGKIKAKILVLNGAADKLVPAEQVTQFREDMQKAGADFKIVNYPDAQHAFTNPDADEYAKRFNVPLGYNAKADHASWAEMINFLNDLFN